MRNAGSLPEIPVLNDALLSPERAEDLRIALGLATRMIEKVIQRFGLDTEASISQTLHNAQVRMLPVDSAAMTSFRGNQSTQKMEIESLTLNQMLFDRAEEKILQQSSPQVRTFQRVVFIAELCTHVYHEFFHCVQTHYSSLKSIGPPSLSLRTMLEVIKGDLDGKFQFHQALRVAMGKDPLVSVGNSLGYTLTHARKKNFGGEKEAVFFTFADEMSVDALADSGIESELAALISAICDSLEVQAKDKVTILRRAIPETRATVRGQGYVVEKEVLALIAQGVVAKARSVKSANDLSANKHESPLLEGLRSLSRSDAERRFTEQVQKGALISDREWLSLIKVGYGTDAYALFARLPSVMEVRAFNADVAKEYIKNLRTYFNHTVASEAREAAGVRLWEIIALL